MDSVILVLFRGSQVTSVKRPDPRGQTRVCIRPADGVGDAQALVEISRMLRLMSMPGKLEPFRNPEPPAATEIAINDARLHPDAAAVLTSCREQHARWIRASIRGLWLAYGTVLRERCDAAIGRFLVDVPTKIARPVLAKIELLRPLEAEDDAFLVWTRLVWHSPEKQDYDYSKPEIRWAWIEVVAARHRLDAMGSAMGLRNAKRLLARALRMLVNELELKKLVLLDLSLDAFDPEEGLLTVKRANSPARATKLCLPGRCRSVLSNWTEVRGPHEGTLFCDPPAAANQRRVPLSSTEVETCLAARTAAPWRPMNNQFIVEALCDTHDPAEQRFIHGHLLDSGDWPLELLREIEPPCPNGVDDFPPLTSYEEKLMRQKLRARLDEIFGRE